MMKYMIRRVGQEMLEALGHETAVAASGEAGIRLFRDTRPAFDFVILDMIMSGLGRDLRQTQSGRPAGKSHPLEWLHKSYDQTKKGYPRTRLQRLHSKTLRYG